MFCLSSVDGPSQRTHGRLCHSVVPFGFLGYRGDLERVLVTSYSPANLSVQAVFWYYDLISTEGSTQCLGQVAGRGFSAACGIIFIILFW